MARRLRVLFMASEVEPFAKTGGLADVAGALPAALAALGHDVRILMPRYRGVDALAGEMRTLVPRLTVTLGERSVEGALFEGRTSSDVPVYFLGQDHYYDRESLYGTADGDYWDNCERFIFFCRGGLEALLSLGEPDRAPWRPQVVHCHDWQTGLVPVYLRTLYRDHPSLGRIATLFTIHNLAYQGVFWHYDMPMTGLGWDLFTPAGLEFYGKLNFLKGGLVFSDLLNTVSRTYAREIRTPEAACRAALRGELSLETAPGPVVGIVTRLVEQKGMDLVLQALPGILAEGCQLVLLGSGDANLEAAFVESARRHPGRVAVRIGYEAELAHRIYAGADCFLMPSRYEPGGLGQLIALRYGTVPVVRRTGGLTDTVTEFDPARRAGTGFTLDAFAVDALLDAVRRAASAYRQPALWKALVRNAMAEDFSWEASAREYVTLYGKALKAKGGPSRQ